MSKLDKLTNRRGTYSLKWDVADSELPMWVADMDFETAPCVIEAIQDRVKSGIFGYSVIPDAYFESYINWWQKRHKVTYQKDWMIFTTGVVPAISSIVRKLTCPAEKVVVMSPVYNIFYNSIYNNGRYILSSDLVYENGKYHIDFKDLEVKLSDPQASLLILCNPHNPIGKIWTKEELANIGHLCKKYNVVVLSDEIHCDIVDTDKNYIPFASVNEECLLNSVTCLAASKAFNLAGLQSACVVVADENLRHKVNRGLNTDEVAEPNAFACVANIAAFTKGEEWLNDLNKYIEENKKLFREFIKKELPNLYVVPSEATYMLWVDCSYYADNADELCDFLRAKTGLYVSSGSVYGKNGQKFFRINLATQKERVIDGLNRLKMGLSAYINR